MIGEPYRGQFLAGALSASIVFIVAATLALALIRLTAIGTDGGFDWRRNPAWLRLTVSLIVVAIVAAVPLSVVAGTAIEAVFEHGAEELLIRREITAQGRSRAFVNDALVTAASLKEHTDPLVELHGQHEHQTLLDPQSHLTLLDDFAAD